MRVYLLPSTVLYQLRAPPVLVAYRFPDHSLRSRLVRTPIQRLQEKGLKARHEGRADGLISIWSR